MKKIILFSITAILILACNSENEENPSHTNNEDVELECLSGFENEVVNLFCNDPEIDSCEYLYAGIQHLSDYAKESFIDFCFPLDSEVVFEDSSGEEVICDVVRKRYRNGSSSISTAVGAPVCRRYCLDNQKASIELKSGKFHLEISVLTYLSGSADTEEELKTNVETRFQIASCFEEVIGNVTSRTHNSFFFLPIEDFNQNVIIPDASEISYHESIVLNGVSYEDVYSSEVPQISNSKVREDVYFNVDLGLIAVRDSLDVLWTKKM